MATRYIYVNPNGSASNDGSQSKPFRSLFHARKIARQYIKSGDSPIVRLSSGIHHVNEPFILTELDSGSVYEADVNASPVISSGQIIGPWIKDEVTQMRYVEGIPNQLKDGNYSTLFNRTIWVQPYTYPANEAIPLKYAWVERDPLYPPVDWNKRWDSVIFRINGTTSNPTLAEQEYYLTKESESPLIYAYYGAGFDLHLHIPSDSSIAGTKITCTSGSTWWEQYPNQILYQYQGTVNVPSTKNGTGNPNTWNGSAGATLPSYTYLVAWIPFDATPLQATVNMWPPYDSLSASMSGTHDVLIKHIWSTSYGKATIQPDGKVSIPSGTWYSTQLDDTIVFMKSKNLYVDQINIVASHSGSADYTITSQGNYRVTSAAVSGAVNLNLPSGVLVYIENATTRRVVLWQNGTPTGNIILGESYKRIFYSSESGYVYEDVTTPTNTTGYWYIDKANNKVWAFTDAGYGEDPQMEAMHVPAHENVITIQGNRLTKATNITVRNITVAHAGWKIPKEGMVELQASNVTFSGEYFPSHDAPAAITVTNAEDCTLDHVTITCCEGNGINIGQYSKRISMTYNDIKVIGGTGIMIGARPNCPRIDTDWADPEAAPANCTVSDCTISDVGQITWGSCGIVVHFAHDNTIQYNEIKSSYYSGISLGFNWAGIVNTTINNVVKNNHIFNVMLALADGGGIYTVGPQNGTLIYDNYIHDLQLSQGAKDTVCVALYLDQTAKGVSMYNNYGQRLSWGMYHWNVAYPEDNNVHDNIFMGDSDPAPTLITYGPR